ncbi:MAG TPA: hypothetical protein VF049_11000 [Nocardioidaceae bacterium]|jgi:hypothetical protein
MSKPVPAALGLVVALVLGLPGIVAAQPAMPLEPVYPPEASPFRHGYTEAMGDYVKWGYQVTAARNPLIHPDSPRNCEVQGDFVYVGSHGAGKDCVVPKGKAVVLGFARAECSRAQGDGDTFAKLRRCARHRFARRFGEAAYRFLMQVDGGLLAKPRRWTFTSENRVVRLPEENIFRAPAGRTKSVTRGLFYIFRPMKPGKHEVRVHGDARTSGKFEHVYAFTVEES